MIPLLPRMAAISLIAAVSSQGLPGQVASRPVELRPWTFLIYAACDNNAEADSNFFGFLDGVRSTYADDPGLEVVLFIDRAVGYSSNATSLGEDFTDARLYRVRAGKSERLAGGREFPEITLTSEYEPDSADPVHVRKFLAFGKAHYPARHYALMLYGHADGRAMCPDEQSGNEMGFAQLTDVVPAELAVDLMALELCNMGGIEIAYQWRPGNGGFATDYLVAIPNAGPPLDWDRVFARLRSGGGGSGRIDPGALSPSEFGALIVEEGGNGRRAHAERNATAARRLGLEAVACYDLSKAAGVKRAVDALAVQLAAGDTKATCEALRGPGPQGFALNYSRDHLARQPSTDLHDLALRMAGCDALAANARKAAGEVATAVDAFVLASYGGAALPRFVPGKSGVYIVFPDGDGSVQTREVEPVRAWDACSWYTPLRVPRVYGNLAWCRDGATADDRIVQNWFELLESWYDRDAPRGGKNGYGY